MKTNYITILLLIASFFAIVKTPRFRRTILCWMIAATLSGLFYDLLKWLLGF